MNSSTGARAVISTPTDTQIEIVREFAAPRELVWRCFTEPKHVLNWWGPRGHENHVAEIDLRPGGAWRFGQRMANGVEVLFGGVYREIDAPGRLVYTERWLNMPAELGGGPDGSEDSVVTVSFAETDGHTTVTTVSEFASQETRDGVLASGMEHGVEESYKRMDDILGELS